MIEDLESRWRIVIRRVCLICVTQNQVVGQNCNFGLEGYLRSKTLASINTLYISLCFKVRETRKGARVRTLWSEAFHCKQIGE